MKRRGFIFTNKKHPLAAVFSFVLGIISVLSFVYALWYSYRANGELPGRFGAAGALTFLYCIVGFIIGALMVQKPDYYKLFSVLGMLLNGLALLGMFFILWIPV